MGGGLGCCRRRTNCCSVSEGADDVGPAIVPKQVGVDVKCQPSSLLHGDAEVARQCNSYRHFAIR